MKSRVVKITNDFIFLANGVIFVRDDLTPEERQCLLDLHVGDSIIYSLEYVKPTDEPRPVIIMMIASNDFNVAG